MSQQKKKKGRLTLNVHGYESKIKDVYLECLAKDKQSYETFDAVTVKIKQLLNLNECKCSAETITKAMKSLDQIIKDKGNKKNNDKTNLVQLEDLLPRIWAIVEKYQVSAQGLFIEQLADMSKGSCAQGRNIRLIQFYILSH